MQKNVSTGVLLVGIGFILLLAQFGWLGDHLVLYFLSVGFFAVYKYLGAAKTYHNIGFLIPATVLLAIALFVDVQRLFNGWLFGAGWFFLLLGGAFLTVYQVHTKNAGTDKSSTIWPLYPAGALVAFGIFIAITEQLETWKRFGITNYVFPIALILVGLYLTFGKKKST